MSQSPGRRGKKVVFLVVCRLVLGCLAPSIMVSGALAEGVVEVGAGWHSLQLEASKWGIDSRSRVRRERLANGDWRIDIQSEYLGKTSGVRVTFDASGAVSESITWRRSSMSSYWNRRTFDREGVQRLRRAPGSAAEAELDIEHWTQESTYREPFPASISGCRGVSEAPVILHLLSLPEVDFSDLCFLTGGALFKIELQRRGDGKTKKRAKEQAEIERLFGADAVPLSTWVLKPRQMGTKAASLKLLGLEGELRIRLGGKPTAPFTLEGKAPWVGKVLVRLTEVE